MEIHTFISKSRTQNPDPKPSTPTRQRRPSSDTWPFSLHARPSASEPLSQSSSQEPCPTGEHCSAPSGPGRNCPGVPNLRPAALLQGLLQRQLLDPPELPRGKEEPPGHSPQDACTQQASAHGPGVLFGFFRNL
uniref:Uncharacterized protein n=1 Tax=Micrurus spixii TaxID=129469 RepID=A0A2D4NAY1_9SAUR